MLRGRRPKPTALRRAEGNPGKRAWNHDEPVPPDAMPDCPPHLGAEAQAEWHRLAETLHRMGVLTTVDRAALAAYCQCWGRWVEAEEKLKVTPIMLKAPSGHIQQSPWLSIANRQLELMGRYMTELGLTPAARSRVAAYAEAAEALDPVTEVQFVIVYNGEDGLRYKKPADGSRPPELYPPDELDDAADAGGPTRILLDGRL
jgi:P27 family predicted phage terminase small subunit